MPVSISFQVFVAPPLYRQQPFWYQRGLTQIASRFSAIFINSPPNLSLLPSFTGQDLMPDGRFLTPVAGLHYILHLFDQTESQIRSVNLNGDSRLALVQEQVRHHEDRMTYLESRHDGLQKQSCTKVAVDAEFNDWMQNRGDEDWFVVRGLPRLNVSRQAWPDAARKQVADLIKLVLTTCRVRLDFEVISVFNPFSRTNTGPTLYNVRMDSVYSSEKIRDLFSGFFRHQRPIQLPSSLKGVEVRNKITLDSKIRISILRQLGHRYQDSNPGSSFKVCGYTSRPSLVTTPARSSTDKPRTYNFIQAVTTLPAVFTDENLAPIFQTIGDRHRGRLQSLFVVLNDDDHDRCLELAKNLVRAPRRGQVPGFAPSSGTSSGPGPTNSSTSVGQVHGRGAGMDVEARHGEGIGISNLVSSLLSPPPPPDSPAKLIETTLSRAHDTRVRQRREHERQPTPPPDVRGLKRRHQSSSPEPEPRRKSKKSGRGKRSRRSRSRSSASTGSGSGHGSGSDSGHSRSRKSHKHRK